MEDQRSPLSWAYYYQDEGIEELKQSLLYSSLELEATIVAAHDEISRKDDEILHLKSLLTRVVEERDEFQAECQRLLLGKQLLLQQVAQMHHIESGPSSGTTSNDDDPIGFSSSDCDENTAAVSPDSICGQPLAHNTSCDDWEKIETKKPLPEKGKLLQAVVEAGPLLQTLLLAGPLPQWQHPPPHLNTMDIPPVSISSPKPRLMHQDSCLSTGSSGKRVNIEGVDFDFSPKHQKVVHPSSLTKM